MCANVMSLKKMRERRGGDICKCNQNRADTKADSAQWLKNYCKSNKQEHVLWRGHLVKADTCRILYGVSSSIYVHVWGGKRREKETDVMIRTPTNDNNIFILNVIYWFDNTRNGEKLHECTLYETTWPWSRSDYCCAHTQQEGTLIHNDGFVTVFLFASCVRGFTKDTI